MKMRTIVRYFRAHPWQRRAVVMLVIMSLAGGIGRLLAPLYYNWKLIEQLGSEDRAARRLAVAQCIVLIEKKKRPALLGALRGELDTENDRRFYAVTEVLQRLGKFGPGQVEPIWLDRRRYLTFLRNVPAPASRPASGPAEALGHYRRHLVNASVIAGRNNRYPAQTAGAAARDPDPDVRTAAAVLAAKLGRADILRQLLEDPEPAVASAAALCAGIARVDGLADRLAEIANPAAPASRDAAVRSSAVYGLARIDAKRAAAAACRQAPAAREPALRERLMIVLRAIGNARCRRAVAELLGRGDGPGGTAPAMVLRAGDALGVPAAEPAARAILATAARGREHLTRAQLIAAMDTARRRGIPCRREICAISRLHWLPGRPLMLVAAAKLLAAQARLAGKQGPGDPGRETCLQLLRSAVRYNLVDEQEDRYLTTPVGSAAAAAELWKMRPVAADPEYFRADSDGRSAPRRFNPVTAIREAIMEGRQPAADYVAWELGTGGIPAAADLGAWFFPQFDAAHIEFDPEIRAAGAMMLALAAQTPQSRQAVSARVEGLWRMEDYLDGCSLLCAQLAAGDTAHADDIRQLFWNRDLDGFPVLSPRRIATGLLLAGDRQFLDDTLLNVNCTDERLRRLLTGGLVHPAFAAATDLPRPDVCARTETQLWIVRIMRYEYGIRREELRIGRR